jgi:signal peptidase II
VTSGIGIRIVLFVAVVITIGCDRVTKHVAERTLAGNGFRSFLSDTVRLQYAENTGGFLGLGGDLHPAARTALFEVATGIILLAIVAWAVRLRLAGWALIGLALFVTGGACNWIDRVARGSVVDFLIVGIGPVRTGIFNVADVAIMVGAAVFALTHIRQPDPTPSGPPDPADGSL